MKVVELLESDWENAPIQTNKHLRYLRQKRASLNHRREIIMTNLRQLFPDMEAFASWRVHQLDLESFPEKSRPYIEELKKIETEGNKLQKDEVAAKINMKYARHDPEFALRHAIVRKGQYLEGEDAIAATAKTAFEYATQVIHHRFPKGEPVIATDPLLKAQYETMFKVKIQK